MADDNVDTGLAQDDFDLAFEAAAAPEGETATDEGTTDEGTTDEGTTDEGTTDEGTNEDEANEGEGEGEGEGDSTGDTSGAETADTAASVADSTSTDTEPTVAEVAAATAEAIEKTRVEAKAVEDKAIADQAVVDRAAADLAATEAPTDVEQDLLDQARVDHPELSQAFDIQMRVALTKMQNEFATKMAEAATNVETRIAPTEQSVQQVAANTHEAAILVAHKDAFDIIPAITKWVATQPAFLKTSYESVLAGGATQDVIDMVTTYKEATGTVKVEAPSAEELAKTAAEEADKEKKLKAQEGVRTRRTDNRTVVDPDDFDGAFEKYANVA